MSKLRSLSTAFWSDPFVEGLKPIQKLLFIYLITNEKTNMLGVYELSIKKMSFETGMTEETIEKALKEFETLGKVIYKNNYVILVNFMKHQNYNTNMKKSAIDAYNELPSELKDSEIKVSKSNPLEGFKTLLNHYQRLSKIEVEYEDEYEVEYEDEKEAEKFSDEIKNFTGTLFKLFPENITDKLNNKDKYGWIDTVNKLIKLDKFSKEQIYKAVKDGRRDEFWNKQFLSLNKLRKKNKDGIKYINVFLNLVPVTVERKRPELKPLTLLEDDKN